ncbi:uncharacterized protein LOC106874590 isoform X1 [Octopus bimaculoides]|uniref:Odorant receptor n=1 Tax=Octopus bimaculoides TaxID=37653 RepID=A0A0L8GV77_OCTBM|nr:uncharacterized protein LOC106874590 isoform X1 [Octopus bimaculoides]|eukprot:XP_014777864.1 PREDICTED: uncharacterized protein LOC106874590 isoform X1 [Octopus bimaculoides]
MPGKRNKIIAKLLSNPSVATMPEDEPRNTYSENNHLTRAVISSTVVSNCMESIDVDHKQPTEFLNEETLVDVFRPVLHFTALSGQEFYPSGYLTKRQQCLCKVFKCIVLLFLVLNIIRLYFMFDINATQGKFIVYLNFVLFYSMEVFKHSMKLIFNIVYGRRLLEKFTAYFPMTEQKYFRKLKRKAKLSVKISTFVIITSITIITVLSSTTFTESTVGSLLHIPMCENKAFEIINTVFLSWFIASGILSDDLLLNFLVKIICCELHTLSQKLKVLDDQQETVRDDQEQTVISKFIHLQKKYEEIMELLQQVNTYFSICVVMTFLFAILVTCTLIYIIFQTDVDVDEKLVVTSMTVTQAFLAISILCGGISIQVAVEEPVEYLYRLSLNKEHSQDTMTRISLFFARVSNPSYLTAAKMFNIDSSTILMISGTLLSYGVIVFQTSSVHTGDKNASMTVLTGNMTGNATFG